jgi:hypothetical protein
MLLRLCQKNWLIYRAEEACILGVIKMCLTGMAVDSHKPEGLSRVDNKFLDDKSLNHNTYNNNN